MRRTTVYLSEEEAEALRRAARQTGKSQSELIRAGIRKVTGPTPRLFHSMGAGKGPGGPTPEWSAEDLYREVMGKE
jgi:Ribbon-helix-helix protein, copG family